MEHEEIEHPNIYPIILDYDDVVDFFLQNSVVGGAYNTIHVEFESESILIWGYCPMMAKDLPYIEDVADLIEHEYMHHLLYVLEGLQTTDSWDNIYWSIFDWIKGTSSCARKYIDGKPEVNEIEVLKMCGDNPETRMEKLCHDFYYCGEFCDSKGNYRTITAQEVADVLDTTPQMAGKVLSIYDNMFRRKVVKGKIVYEPKG
jgi:hypothetical protein